MTSETMTNSNLQSRNSFANTAHNRRILSVAFFPRLRFRLAMDLLQRKQFTPFKQNVARFCQFALIFALTSFLSIFVSSNSFAESITKNNELGPVAVETILDPSDPKIGDQISLTIKVTSKKDVEVLMPEFGEALSRYTILDFVPRKKVESDGTLTQSQKYTLQPYLSGDQSIPPILIEFVDNREGQKKAPDEFDAYEILTDRIDFQVQSVAPKNAGNDLKPPLGELEISEDSVVSSTWFWIPFLLLVPMIAISVLLFVFMNRKQVVRRSAYEIARTKLDKLLAKSSPKSPEEIEVFFVSISSIIRTYLEDRFELRAPDLTTEEFLELASRAENLSSEHQRLLNDFLRQADLVKFAGVQTTEEDVTRSRDLAIRFLEETRENAPLLEQPEESTSEIDQSKKEAANA